ncbi:MAG TPA: twin-arginine translocase subunit TatC, partial [Nitrososphaeraceae archaeon]|jgi:sec-independent protein translocase protein TatC|nr:twin-arginine translocase subunit TatC [Nitrososphaeraceae archaeon]
MSFSSSSKEMPLRQHIEELRSRILRIVICVIIIIAFSMSFGIRPLVVGDSILAYYPYPDPFHNIAIQVTKYMQETLLPHEVKLIQTAPGQAFFSQIYVSMLIGIIASMPIIIKETFGFISPAIENKTRIGILNIFLPTLLLFVSGIIFSYILVIPFVLDFLYSYGQAIGVETFLNIDSFISFVLQFFLGFGITFELPMIMYAIALTGVLNALFWRKNFRYAIILFVIFGAIITPDGSGITMWLVTLPMLLLYFMGMIVIENREKRELAKSSLENL